MRNTKKYSVKRDELQKITLSENQVKFFKTIRNNTITFAQGPAGSSKTFTACYSALWLLAEKKIKQIILVKPIQEAGGERLGFLPGDMAEKVDPYMESYFSNFAKIIGKSAVEFMLNTEDIIIKPLAYMRGAGYDNALIIIDEAQNMDYKALMMAITRIGYDSKIVVTGDISQYDIRKNNVALPKFIELMADIPNVSSFKFEKTDIVRNPILIEITDRYEKWKLEKNL